MLYVFDVDGTLIEGFLGGEECEECKGEGRRRNPEIEFGRPPRAPEIEPWIKCAACRGKGQHFGEHVPYHHVTPLPGRAEVVERLALEPDAHFALATNQGGVAMGYQEPDEVWEKMARVLAEFEFFHSRATSVHIATNHPEAKDEIYRDPELLKLRKPLPGMLLAAMQAHNATPRNTIFVGDMPVDRDCAEAAGVRFVWAKHFFADES
jgi:histidinol phosphatase-like enzyme